MTYPVPPPPQSPSPVPTRKVTAGVLAGALSVLATGVAARNGIDLSVAEGQAVTVVITFVASYFVKD